MPQLVLPQLALPQLALPQLDTARPCVWAHLFATIKVVHQGVGLRENIPVSDVDTCKQLSPPGNVVFGSLVVPGPPHVPKGFEGYSHLLKVLFPGLRFTSS